MNTQSTSTDLPLSRMEVLLSFHASTVIIDGKAILFTGEGGAGKSTIAELFELDGFESPGDEVANVYLDNRDIWRLHSTQKKVNGEYQFIDNEDCPVIAMIVFLRSHVREGYTIEDCRETQAVQKGISCLFCDWLDCAAWYSEIFHRMSSLMRQSIAVSLDFSKSLDFVPAIRTILAGRPVI